MSTVRPSFASRAIADRTSAVRTRLADYTVLPPITTEPSSVHDVPRCDRGHDALGRCKRCEALLADRFHDLEAGSGRERLTGQLGQPHAHRVVQLRPTPIRRQFASGWKSLSRTRQRTSPIDSGRPV